MYTYVIVAGVLNLRGSTAAAGRRALANGPRKGLLISRQSKEWRWGLSREAKEVSSVLYCSIVLLVLLLLWYDHDCVYIYIYMYTHI